MADLTKLKQKIRSTALFAEDEKVDILAAMDGYAEADLTELESIIDDYNASHATLLKTFEKHMDEELDTIVAKAEPAKKPRLTQAAEQIKQGLSAVTDATLNPRP